MGGGELGIQLRKRELVEQYLRLRDNLYRFMLESVINVTVGAVNIFLDGFFFFQSLTDFKKGYHRSDSEETLKVKFCHMSKCS